MKWLAHRSIYSDSTDLVLVDYFWVGDKMAVAKPVELLMVTQDANSVIAEPTFRLPGDQGQSLMQALWDAGLRPNDGEGSGAEVKALRQHIAFAEHVAKSLLPVKDL